MYHLFQLRLSLNIDFPSLMFTICQSKMFKTSIMEYLKFIISIFCSTSLLLNVMFRAPKTTIVLLNQENLNVLS